MQNIERSLLRDTRIRRLLMQAIDQFHGRGPTPPGSRRDATGFESDRTSRCFV